MKFRISYVINEGGGTRRWIVRTDFDTITQALSYLCINPRAIPDKAFEVLIEEDK